MNNLNYIDEHKSYIEFDIADSVNAVVHIHASDEREIVSIVSFFYTAFSYFNTKVKYTWEYEEGFTDGVIHIFDRKSQLLPIGLIPRAVKYLRKRNNKIHIKLSDSLRNLFESPNKVITRETIMNFINTLNLHNAFYNTSIIPYEHQIKLIDRALNARRISLLACTSSGKSLAVCIIARYLMAVEKKKILIVVPATNLVEQLYSDFHDEYGWDDAEKYCSLIYSDSKDKLSNVQKKHLEELNLGEEVMLKNITISTWQSLQNKPDDFFKPFNAVIVDEAHGTRGLKLREIVDKCVNAMDFKIGVSGTLPDDGLDAAWIEGALGRKEIIVKLKDLVEKKILTPVDVSTIIIPYVDNVRPLINGKTYQEEYSLITNNGSRKRVMDILISSNKITTDTNTLILYKSKTTLDDMYNYLTVAYPQFSYHVIKGEINVTDREVIRKKMECGTGNIIIATYGTMKQGVNIKLLHNLIFAEFSKSMYEVVQSIGRIVRKHELKKYAHVFDICDDCSYYTKPRKATSFPRLKENYSLQHYSVRKEYYENDDIPITEYKLDGIYEATIDSDSLLEKKKKATSKLKTKKKKIAIKKTHF